MQNYLVKIIISIFFTGFFTDSKAQIEQGTFCIDPYIGVPGEKITARFISPDHGTLYTGWPISVGGRAEFLVSNWFGLGMDINYSVFGYEYTEEDEYYNSVTSTYEDVFHEFKARSFRYMARVNYHFLRTEKIDAYFGGGIGGRNVKVQQLANGAPNGSNNVIFLPIAVRIACGGHYYFTDNIGISAEFGLYGGGFLQCGLAIKF